MRRWGDSAMNLFPFLRSKTFARGIHPGTPWNMGEPGVEKLMARAAKFN